MTCHVGENLIVCDGQSGWRVYPAKYCPWCLDLRRCIGTAIFSGWCGYDYICGTCGTKWSTDDAGPLGRGITEEQRKQNIARVAAMSDPKCWDCHDTGITGESTVDMGWPCHCERGAALRAGEEKERP